MTDSEMTFEQFAAKRGYGTGSRPTASHIRSTKNMSGIALRRAQKQHLVILHEWEAKRSTLRVEYDRLKISYPSRIQRLQWAARGHSDLLSTQIARKLLAKIE